MKALTIVLVACFLVLSSATYSETLKLGVGGGIALIRGNKSFTDDISAGGQGFSSLHSVRGKVAVSLASIPISLAATISYQFMSGKGDFNSSAYQPILNGSTEIKMRMLSLAVGGQWTMYQGPIAPYAGAHVLLSSFGHSTRTVTNASGVHEFSGGSGTNYGIGFALGAEIRVLPKLDIDLNAAYDFNTLFGGSFGTSNFNTFGFAATVLFTVN